MKEDKLKKDIKSSFSKISASEEIKKKTKLYIEKETRNYGKEKGNVFSCTNYLRYASCIVAFMVVLLFGGYEFYFNTIISISVDINPSVELGINRVGKVISVDGYNDDGILLANQLDIKYKSYDEAILEMIDSEIISGLMNQDEILSIGVIGNDNNITSKIVEDLQSFTEEKENIECYFEKEDNVKQAHDLGLSHGKYKAYLEYKKVDESITIEEIKSMTMKEIRQSISSCTGNANCNGHGNRQQNHKGQGKGK